MSVAKPPAAGYFVLRLLLRRPLAQTIVGDLDELYYKDLRRVGLRRETILYWKEVLDAVIPAFIRILLRLGALALLQKAARE